MRLFATAALLLAACSVAACTQDGFIGMTVGSTLLGAQAPGNEIEQVYYLGAFDPQGQLPPSVYRVTVHGQASAISQMKFGSGWVPAQTIDSLSSSIGFDNTTGRPTIDVDGKKEDFGSLKTGRRLVLFGPEGFREAPRDHRLVIVMGSNPDEFFKSIDMALTDVSTGRARVADTAANQDLLEQLVKIRDEMHGLDSLEKQVANQFPADGGGK
jgi:hypothetical protein